LSDPKPARLDDLERRVAKLELGQSPQPSRASGRPEERGCSNARYRISASAVIFGIVVGAVLVLANLHTTSMPLVTTPAPVLTGSVTIEGIRNNITYTPGSYEGFIEGQNDCDAHCPSNISGGTDWTLVVFEFGVGSGYNGILDSLSVTSVVPFKAVNCESPGPCGATTHYLAEGISVVGPSGFAQQITLFIGDPAPDLPNGFWIYCNATLTERIG